MHPVSLGVVAVLCIGLVAACSVTVPPPVDVRGPTPVVILPPEAPPATVVTPRAN